MSSGLWLVIPEKNVLTATNYAKNHSFRSKIEREIRKSTNLSSFLNVIKQIVSSANADFAWISVATILIYLAVFSLKAVIEVKDVKDQNNLKENNNPETISS